MSSTVALLELDLTPAHFKGLSLHVIFMLIPMIHDTKRHTHGAILAKLAELVVAGTVKPLIDDQVFKFGEVNQAYERLASGKAVGNVVVEK